MKRNQAKDVLHIPSLKIWSAKFTGTAPRDNYLDPLRAPPEWWVGLPIRDVLIVSGADEIFVDDIDVFARKLSVWWIPDSTSFDLDRVFDLTGSFFQAIHPSVSHFSASGEAHIQLFTDFMIRQPKSKQRDVFQRWIEDKI